MVYLSGNQPDCYESYVYAFQCGADRADTARSDKGDQTADYRGRILCRISDCALDLAQMQVFGKTWLDLCRNRNCSPWNRADFRTGDARLEAVLVDRWNYLPAVGVCQTDVRIFSGSGSFRKDRNPAGGRSWNRSNSACADSRTVEGSGKRVDSFYGVCVSDDDFCTSATVSGWRACRRGRRIVACVPDVFPCTGARAGVERSMECD